MESNKTVRLETGIQKRYGKKGITYKFTVPMGIDVNGKQIRKTTTWKAPEGTTERKADKQAKEEYINFKNRLNGNIHADENMRFISLCDMYFKLYTPTKLKPVTEYNYKKMFELRIIPYFGNKKLKDINNIMIESYIDSLTNERTGSPLGLRTKKRVFNMIQSIMHFAKSKDIISNNPCEGIEIITTDPTKDEKRKYLTQEELSTFLSLFDAEKSDFDRMILLLLHTGMRSGELLGLQWKDIDFKNREFHINHTLSDVGGTHFLTTPKSKESKRLQKMSESVFHILKLQRKYQIEKQMVLESFPHPEMVFTSATGNYKDRSCLNTSFKKRLKGSGLEFLTLHCLRHSNATFLLNSGVDLKIVSEHLGHSDVGITGKIYADVLKETKQKTADTMETIISQAN